LTDVALSGITIFPHVWHEGMEKLGIEGFFR